MASMTIGDALYTTFGPAERHVLMLQAMARLDYPEAERLTASCPRRSLRGPELGFFDRQTIAFNTAAVACTDLQRLCGMLKVVRWTAGVVKVFAAAEAMVAELAFLDGLECAAGRPPIFFFQEPPGLVTLAPHDGGDLGAVGAELDRRVGRVIARVHGDGEQVLGIVARSERNLANELAVAWAAFGRFCRTRAGVEPETLLAAWNLPVADDVLELLTLCPHDEPDPEKVDGYFNRLSVLWDERIGTEGGDSHGR